MKMKRLHIAVNKTRFHCMYITLSIELFSQNQTELALELLKFPSRLLSTSKAESSISVRSAWGHATANHTDLYQFVTTKTKGKLNEIKVEYKFPSPSYIESEMFLLSVYQTFDVSPTNSIWSSTDNWPSAKVIQHHSGYFNLRNKEQHLKTSGVTQCPSCLRSHINFQTDLPQKIAVEKLLNYIEICVVDIPSCSDLFGAGDYTISSTLPSRVNTPNIMANLSDRPRAYPSLGRLLDRMHPWILNNTEYCNKLEKMLSGKVILNDLSTIYPQCDLAALHIPREIAQSDALLWSASSLFVPRDQLDSVGTNTPWK